MLRNEWPMLPVFLGAPRTFQPFVTLFLSRVHAKLSLCDWYFKFMTPNPSLECPQFSGPFAHLSVLQTMKKFQYRFYSLPKVKFAAMTFFLLAYTGRWFGLVFTGV